MNAFGVDIATMLDDLKLPLAAIRWKEILRGPELENLSAQQLLREVYSEGPSAEAAGY